MGRITNADKVMEKMKTEWQRRKHIAASFDGEGMTRPAFSAGLLALHRQGRIEIGYMEADGSVKVATPKQGKPPAGTELAYRIKA